MHPSVRGKLLVGFAIVIALSAVGGTLSLGNMSTLSGLTVKMYSNNFVAMSRLSNARIAATRHALLTDQVVRATDPARRKQLAAQRREREAEFLAAFEAVESVYTTPRGQELIAQIRSAAGAYKAASDEQIAAAGSADASRLLELSRTLQQRLDEFDERLDQLVSLGNELAANDAAQAQFIVQDVWGVTILLLALLVIIGIAVALWLSHSIGSGMRIAAAAASRSAEGDLTQPAPVSSRDEIGELGMSINEMVRGLNQVAAEIREIVQSLASAASEILAAITQQGASTTERATAIDQTTALVDEVRVSAQQTTQTRHRRAPRY